MITAILIILILLIVIAAIFLIAISFTLKDEFKKKAWMDNSEFDYGHNVHYSNDADNFLN